MITCEKRNLVVYDDLPRDRSKNLDQKKFTIYQTMIIRVVFIE